MPRAPCWPLPWIHAEPQSLGSPPPPHPRPSYPLHSSRIEAGGEKGFKGFRSCLRVGVEGL